MTYAKNIYEFAFDMFEKAAKGKYPARTGAESVRAAIRDFEGVENRNRLFDLDHTSFYMETFEGKEYWVGVCDNISTDKYMTVSKYSDLFNDLGKVVIMPPVNTKTLEQTVHYIKTMNEFLMDFLYPENICDGEYLCMIRFANVHIITYYFWSNYRINLTTRDNFNAAFVDTGIMSDSEDTFNFFAEDFKYVNSKSVEFPGKYKLLGTFNRWRNKYGITAHAPLTAREPADKMMEEESNESGDQSQD